MFGGEIQTEQKKYRICIRAKVDDNNLINNRNVEKEQQKVRIEGK